MAGKGVLVNERTSNWAAAGVFYGSSGMRFVLFYLRDLALDLRALSADGRGLLFFAKNRG